MSHRIINPTYFFQRLFRLFPFFSFKKYFFIPSLSQPPLQGLLNFQIPAFSNSGQQVNEDCRPFSLQIKNEILLVVSVSPELFHPTSSPLLSSSNKKDTALHQKELELDYNDSTGYIPESNREVIITLWAATFRTCQWGSSFLSTQKE